MKKIFLIYLILSLSVLSCKNFDVTNVKNINIAVYPEDYLTMKLSNNVENINSEPFVYAYGIGVNGDFRIAFYEGFDTFEISINSEWQATQTVYKDSNYATSEGVSVGLKKTDVISAYEKYGIIEHEFYQITQFGLDSIDIAIKGIDLNSTFLYIDNRNIFMNLIKVLIIGVD